MLLEEDVFLFHNLDFIVQQIQVGKVHQPLLLRVIQQMKVLAKKKKKKPFAIEQAMKKACGDFKIYPLVEILENMKMNLKMMIGDTEKLWLMSFLLMMIGKQ